MAASRHLWVGGLPEDIGEAGIKDYFSKFGKIEGVKILPQRYPNIGVAAFIDFYTKESAIDAKDAKHKISGCDIRTNFKSKPAENPMQRKWPESTSIEKQEKQGKTRGHQSSSSSSGSDSDSNAGNSSSSSSSSSSSESDKEGESGEKKAKKKGGEAEHVFLKITGLAHRPERVLQDGLYYEFTRHSPGALVQMYGEEGQEMPWAVVRFKTAKECKAAYSHAQGLALFGSKIKLTPLNTDDFPRGGRNLPLPSLGSGPPPGPMGGGGHMPHPFNPSDDVDPQATRSLFVGNIPKNISVFQLRDIFQRYGDVLDVEIKKMSGNATYGFVLFYDLMSAIHAKQYMDGENVHGNHIRVGFGKGTPSKTLWVDGIDPNTAEPQLERHMAKHGRVLRLGIDRQRCCAMVQYDDAGAAKEALNSVKGTFLGNSKRLMTDFANRDARAAFFSRLEGGGGGGGGGGPPPRGFPGPGMYNPSYGPGPRGGGMMMPRPGMHMMGMGRGGFPPHGHGPPMDFYYNPYMDDNMGYYGGGRPPFHGGPGPMGMRRFSHGRGPFEEGFDEYEEELRAFTRKREWEKEHEKRKEKRKRHSSESESDETDSDDLSLRRKRKSSREKDKHKKASKKDKSKEKEKDTGKEKKSAEKSEGEMDSDGDEKREDARIKATQKSRDLREKLKKKSRRRKEKEAKSDGEASSESESSEETEVKKVKKEKSKEKDRGKEREKNKDKSKVPKKGRGIEREDKSATPSRHSKSPLSPPPKPPVKEPPKAKEKGRHSAKEQEKDWDKTERAAKPKPPEPVEPPPVSRNGKLKKGNLRSESSNEGEEQKSTPHTKDIHERKSEVIKSPPSAHIPDTPQSPVQEEKTRVKEKLESDLSSGEDFKDGEFEPVDEPLPPPKPKITEKESSSSDPDSKPQHRPVVKQRQRLHEYERSPKLLSPNLEMETEGHHELTARHFFSGEESDDTKAMEAGLAAVKKPRKLPRRYQLEEEEPSFVPSSRREKYRESKETRDRPEKRHHLPPTTPSPPPAFVSHRRRHHPSPPPPEYLERRWHRRGRPYSPGHYPPPRRYSRSPPGYPPSPPHRGRSPFSGSPPPRARTPIQRPRDRGMPRHRYESPPYNLPPRGKYPRRGSPPSPPHHRYHSPSPPPRSRSPRRRHLRHRSPSISPPHRSPPYRSPPHRSPPHRSPPRRSPPRRSPPRRSPPRRRERSHSSESERSSSRYPDDRYDSRRKLKRPVYSRTPSPRGKHHDPDKGSYQQLKRQRMEESHPKSPSSTPPPPKEDPKPGKPDKTSSHAPPSRFSSSDVSSGSQKYPSQVKGRGSSDQQSYMHQQQQVQPVSSHMKVPPSHYHQPPLMQPHAQPQQPHLDPQQTNNLLDLLRRYPVMWQGHLTLKNDSAAVQLHFLSGNLHLAKVSLPQQSDQRTPALRISQRMRLEQTQLEGVDRRMQNESEYCLLLALPCGRDANDVRTQTHALKNSLITYLLQKQAAGIINVQGPQTGFVLHIFPPCPFSQAHLSRVAPDLLSSASDNCHLMIMVATM